MKRKSIVAGLATCLSLIAISAQATGPYVGVLGGSIETQQRIHAFEYVFNDAGEAILEGRMESIKEDRSAYGALFGWQLHRNFALETAYLRATTQRETFTDATTWELRQDAWTASALYTLPLSARWSTYARLGGIRRTYDHTVVFQGVTPRKDSAHQDGILYGAGLGMQVKQLNLRFDLQRTNIQSQRTTVMSLGLNWLF